MTATRVGEVWSSQVNVKHLIRQSLDVKQQMAILSSMEKRTLLWNHHIVHNKNTYQQSKSQSINNNSHQQRSQLSSQESAHQQDAIQLITTLIDHKINQREISLTNLNLTNEVDQHYFQISVWKFTGQLKNQVKFRHEPQYSSTETQVKTWEETLSQRCNIKLQEPTTTVPANNMTIMGTEAGF